MKLSYRYCYLGVYRPYGTYEITYVYRKQRKMAGKVQIRRSKLSTDRSVLL